MPKVEIDGKEIEVEKGTNLILAAIKGGIYIPHYCYHPLLPVVAQCRMCLVMVEGSQKPVAACTITVEKDMKVLTKDKKIEKLRNLVLELLLQHHPVDCPVCPRSGECDLQNFTFIWGPERKRYDGERRLKGYVRVSDKIILFKERCILCTRCVRFTEKYGNGGIAVTRRGFMSDLVIEKSVNSNYSGNIVDLCPVGALVDEAMIYLPRAWRVRRTLTHCFLCERGCQVLVESWKNKIVRVKAFDNMLDKTEEEMYSEGELLNEIYTKIKELPTTGFQKLYSEENMLICDIGRWKWREFISKRERRILNVKENKEVSIETLKNTLKIIKGKKIAILISPFATVEEAEKISRIPGEKSIIPPPKDKGDELLLREIRAPNLKGVSKYFEIKNEVLTSAQNGEYDAVIVYGLGTNYKVKANFVLVIDLYPKEVDGESIFFFPATHPYEKNGTYINFEGKEKKIFACVDFPLKEEELFSEIFTYLNS